ncbi:MAG TPA: hypothetical protein PLI52_01235 [Prochlorococcaceae cyanobacterium AMR_MDS_5431]|nr:hypothetical protein [Prochlorococcaceae cyanobacterium AMR_MDS_5431]
MSTKDKRPFPSSRQLDPLPKGLLRLYGLIAILAVLIPEWVAGSTLRVFPDNWEGCQLPLLSYGWYDCPELRLATMTICQLRILAGQTGLRNYSHLNRERLVAHLLKYSGRNPTSSF